MANNQPVLRLVFGYEGDNIKLENQQMTDMVVSPSHPVEEFRGKPGNWFEVQDAAGRCLYGRQIHEPIRTHHEVFDADGARWVPRAAVHGVFQILAPLLPGAAAVVVFGSGVAVGADKTGPAREIARVDVRRAAR